MVHVVADRTGAVIIRIITSKISRKILKAVLIVVIKEKL